MRSITIQVSDEVATIQVPDKVAYELIKKYSNEVWNPKVWERYWCVSDGNEEFDVNWDNDNIDKYRYLTGNCYQSEEQAQKANKRIKAIGRVTHAIHKANGNWKPDWSDEKQPKCFIYYDNGQKRFWKEVNWTLQSAHCIPYLTFETALYIIKEHEADLKLIFWIE